MRPDMFEVIIERPRRGGRGLKRQWPPRRMGEELPKRDSTSRRRGGSKYLNENLAPLRRFLRSRVGRPWDKVYSEISEHLSAGNAVQRHVRDHLEDFVALHVDLVDGELRRLGRRWFRGVRDGTMYVCPRTGLLKVWRARPRPPGREPVSIRWIDEHRCHAWLHGAWFIVAVAPATPHSLEMAQRGLLLFWDPERRMFVSTAPSTWSLVVTSKRQLSRKEIQAAGLQRPVA